MPSRGSRFTVRTARASAGCHPSVGASVAAGFWMTLAYGAIGLLGRHSIQQNTHWPLGLVSGGIICIIAVAVPTFWLTHEK